MLTASRLQPKPGKSTQTIAGANSGKRVLCSPNTLPEYNELVKLAKNGNHWAGLVVRGIEGLTSGRLNKDNIYIDKRMSLAYGRGSFHVVLPGVTATLDHLDNDKYILQHIKVDDNYQKLQENGSKPGLWRVSTGDNAEPEHQSDGKVLKKDTRHVVITDMASNDPKLVSRKAALDLSNKDATIKNIVSRFGFDMHYTPGDSDIVGLKKAKDALTSPKERDITQSAILLANTMYKAQNQEGVIWFSDWGGSAILTRAMQILHQEKGIKLEKHSVFLNRPTSKPKEAFEIAEKLGITKLDKGKNSGWRPKEIMGHIDATDISGAGTLGAAKYTTGAIGAAAAIGSLTGVVPTIAGIAGAMFFIGSTINSSRKSLKGKQYK